jgi:23S rRNA (uridine2479-2'-O)-methyltransferase
VPERISSRNARFQQWQALLTNRRKRQQEREFLVHGVRPITLAMRHRWPLSALLYDADRRLSGWASETLQGVTESRRVAVDPDLLAELSEKDDDQPELIAVAAIPPDDFGRIPDSGRLCLVVFDRPSSPGNIGTLIRSADAFGASAVIVTGHAADPYDPKSVRASTGSLFAVPVIRAASPAVVRDWLGGASSVTAGAVVAGLDEQGQADIAGYDLTQPLVLVVGNETTGLSAAWRSECDVLLRIPIAGSASSLNAATAGTIALYEAVRQRTVT